MSITNRWVCLACSKFINIEERPKYCPHCHDEYFCDNVVPGVPVELGTHDVTCECGLEFKVETTRDLKYCPRDGGVIAKINPAIIIDIPPRTNAKIVSPSKIFLTRKPRMLAARICGITIKKLNIPM